LTSILPAAGGAPRIMAYDKAGRQTADGGRRMIYDGFDQLTQVRDDAKNLTDPLMLEKIYERILARYGEKLGPSIDWLRAQGKSWDQIVESATRTGGKDLGL
jgi:hypothetical protein